MDSHHACKHSARLRIALHCHTRLAALIHHHAPRVGLVHEGKRVGLIVFLVGRGGIFVFAVSVEINFDFGFKFGSVLEFFLQPPCSCFLFFVLPSMSLK